MTNTTFDSLHFRDKTLWALSQRECDFVYQHLHMDNYVYLAFRAQSEKWGHKALDELSASDFSIPAFYEELSRFRDLIAQKDPVESTPFRVAVTTNGYRLFSNLNRIQKEQLKATLTTLHALTPVSISADKNDEFPIWDHPIVRAYSPERQMVFNKIRQGISPESFFKLPSIAQTRWNQFDAIFSPIEEYVIRCVEHIIITIENTGNTPEVSQAFCAVEHQMLDYENKYGIGNRNMYPCNMKNPYQIRYRNTLYLYGGNHFQRRSKFGEAFEWYTKDIYSLDVLDISFFYLTTLKTCERFLCSIALAPFVNQPTGGLVNILDNLLLVAFEDLSQYSKEVVAFISANPQADLIGLNIPCQYSRGAKEVGMHFAGEAAREMYLIASLYVYTILKQPCWLDDHTVTLGGKTCK